MPAATEAQVWPTSRSSHPPPDEPAPRRWTWRLGRIFGVEIHVHGSFAFLLAWVAVGHARGGGAAVLRGLALVLSVFAIVVIHELSHALVARRFGFRTRDITLLPIGGVARFERMPEKPIEELLVALAGPSVNIALALVLWGILALTGANAGPPVLGGAGGSFLSNLMWVNVSLAVFNLLPAFPMDGGRVLRAALALRMDHVRATELAARIGQGMAVLFGVVGIFLNPLLILIALFVWMGAEQESVVAGLKRSLSGVPVGSAMVTGFQVLSPSDRLSTAADLMVTGFQHDFPVVRGRRLVGVLTRSDVVRGLSGAGAAASVEDSMHREFTTAESTDMLASVLNRLPEAGAAPVVVLRGNSVAGLLTVESMGEFLVMQAARRGERAR
jgi:Zn-dependent protease/CBS domain-containing protein